MKKSLFLYAVSFGLSFFALGCQNSSSGTTETDNAKFEAPKPETQTPVGPQPVASTPAPTTTPRPIATPKPKAASIVIESGAALTSATQLRLELKTVQGLKMKISEDGDCKGGSWEAYATQKLWNLSGQNKNVSLSAVFQDYDGALSVCATSSIIHDNNGPQIDIQMDPKNTYAAGSTTTVHLTLTDVGAGLKSATCAFNGAPMGCQLSNDGKAVLMFPSQAAGNYQFSAMGEDALGNKSSASRAWTVKTTYRRITQNASIKSQNKVDILLITDNSGSMQYEQQSMAKRMGTFISKLQGLDWKIGITTTDPRNITLGDGRLVPMKTLKNTYAITSAMNAASAQSILGQTIQRSETGFDQEQGIYVTYRSIERSLTSSDPTNAGFLRADAAFAAVVISDEDESATGAKNKPENLLKFVQDTYKGTKKFVFHSIITKPGDAVCQKQQGFNYGTVYAKMSTLTGAGTVGGAIIGSVCEADYAGQLSGIGQSIQDMKRTIDLQCAPIGNVNSAVLINLNGQPYNERYEVQGAKVTFEKPLPAGDYRLEYDCP